MAEITAAVVKELREKTGAGMMDCKKALVEANGDMEKANDVLRKKGIARASKKADRAVNEGRIESYIHPGSKLGVMVEINCETDFVAKTDDFMTFTRDVAMHIAASAPGYVRREEVEQATIDRELEIFHDQAKAQGKPVNIIDKIAAGKMDKFYSEVCLLEQPFVKDPDKTIQDLLTDTVAKLGENISIRRFTRFKIGE
ncbi:MAG: translation elongation factor Ts [Calditrichales bacterium]|nr:MAG: translation elongation factor Ts [Calditrichales bacterium]